MKRLTEYDANGEAQYRYEGYSDIHMQKVQKSMSNPAIATLAAYEDAGFTPEEVAVFAKWEKEARQMFDDTVELLDYRAAGLTPEEVEKLAQAKEQGRLVVLPCKIGTEIFTVDYHLNRAFPMRAAKEDMLTKIMPGLGKRYFLTREEAETALSKERTYAD